METSSLVRACLRCGTRREINPSRPLGEQEFCGDCKTLVAMPTPLVVDEHTACHQSKAFWELEANGAERINDPRVRTSPAKREATIKAVEQEARERFCGPCPIRDACLEWCRDARHTGIGGGRWLVDGLTLGDVPRGTNPKIRNQHNADPLRCINGHLRSEHGYLNNRGWWACQVCRREQHRRHAAEKRRREREARAAA